MDNIRRAWRFAARHRETRGLADALPGLTAINAKGGWRYYSVDNLTAWAMLLTSDCPLRRNDEPFLEADRVTMAREILILTRDYDPDRSRAISRIRAAKLLAELSCNTEAESGLDPAAPAAQRTAEEIARALLTFHLA